MDDITENITIYKNILEERKRYKVSEYIKRSQDDLERILSTLHQHFENVKLTSFEVETIVTVTIFYIRKSYLL